MMGLSNKPAPYVGMNMRAICDLPNKSIWQRIFSKSLQPVPLTPEVRYAFRVINERLGFNIMLLVEDPDLWTFAEAMIDHHDLPVQQKVLVTDWDSYSLLRHVYTIEGVIWAGEEHILQTAEVMFVSCQDDLEQSWFSFIDLLGHG